MDWLINKDQYKISIDTNYADDLSIIKSYIRKMKQIDQILLGMLKKEPYHYWRKNRKHTYWGIHKKAENIKYYCFKYIKIIFKNKNSKLKIKVSKTYIGRTFLCSSKQYLLVKSSENVIDKLEADLMETYNLKKIGYNEEYKN